MLPMNFSRPRFIRILALMFLAMLSCSPARAVILWSLPGPVTVQNNGAGRDILGGAVSRNKRDNDALYFKFRVDPISDVSKEEYYAGFQLYEDDTERLGVGNSLKAWAYSAFNTDDTGENNQVFGDMDLHSANPESYEPGKFLAYELPRHGIVRTIIFKVQYIPNGDDLVTVWIDPDLSPGMTEDNQLTILTTQFRAKATFNQIRLRHGGGGDGWTFSDMAIATSFEDFIVRPFWRQWWFLWLLALFLMLAVVTTVRVVEKRKFKLQLQRAEQAHALERERGRIAQDLHDDLGSSLTQISLLGGLLRTDKDNPTQVEAHASKLTAAADQSVRALEEIVWAVRPVQRHAAKPRGLHRPFCERTVRGQSHQLPPRPADRPAGPRPAAGRAAQYFPHRQGDAEQRAETCRRQRGPRPNQGGRRQIENCHRRRRQGF